MKASICTITIKTTYPCWVTVHIPSSISHHSMVLVSSQDVLSFYCFLDNSYKNERISHFNAKHWGSLINQKCTQRIYCTNFTPQAMLFWKSIWQSLFMPLIALVELLAFPSRWQMLSSLFKVFSTSLCQHLIHLINGLARTLSKCLSDLLRPDLLQAVSFSSCWTGSKIYRDTAWLKGGWCVVGVGR